jgi:alpha-D-ribose 1-methylphosphonate 5-triphosphate diphosphatase
LKKCIFNATVVAPGALLPNHAVFIQDDRIASVTPMDSLPCRSLGREDIDFFDARNGYVMPGFIDVHSDYIEGILQPRPTCLMDFETGLREAEKQLLGHGVTTIYHSLSLMKSGGARGRHSFRTPENLERLVDCIGALSGGQHLIRHRFHARYEIDNLEIYGYLLRLMDEGRVHELSFMDHTPGQGQYRNLEIYAQSYVTWDAGYSDAALEDILAAAKNKPVASHEMLKRLSRLARERGITLASHDDDSPEKLAFMKNEYGVQISEFPVELEVARKARAEGVLVVLGAPNIMLGGSHSGNLSALEAIREGCADILCSDYYPAALLHAVFKLEAEGILSLPEAVRMVTLNPARAMGLSADYGSLEAGKKADLLVVKKIQGCPMIQKCFIDGRAAAQFDYYRGAA